MLAELFCGGGSDDGSCYREYPLGVFQPAHIAIHPDGHVWFTDYAAGTGSQIGRLDPTAGAVELFPLPPAPFEPRVLPLAMINFGLLAPWDIEIDRRGDVVATQYAQLPNRTLRPRLHERYCGVSAPVRAGTRP